MKKLTSVQVTGNAFVSHVDNSKTPTMQFDFATIFDNGCNFHFRNISSSGIAKLMGYAYDLRPFLKKYLVKQYGSWQEYFAPNKTMLRRCLIGSISQIVELQSI